MPKSVELSALWYLWALAGENDGGDFSRFQVGRGYLTAKFEPVEWLSGRMTIDTRQNDDGDWVVLLKFLYAQFNLGNAGKVLTDATVECGLARTPWIDFEHSINRYRAQGAMFLNRTGLVESADLGVMFAALLGEKLPKEYRETVSDKYAGQYGSLAVGVYNGGGYRAKEVNDNKALQGRLSVRPLGPLWPNLQLSYLGTYGKGNSVFEQPQANGEPRDVSPDWHVHAGMASVEHRLFAVTVQGAVGEGDAAGLRVVEGTTEAMDFHGYSAFGELKLPWIKSSVIGRYDRINWGYSDNVVNNAPPLNRYIAGAAYHFLPGMFVLFDWDAVDNQEGGGLDEQTFKLTLQVSFKSS